MKAPSVRDFSVFSHLGNLGTLQWTNIHVRSFEENFEKIREFHWINLFITYFCTETPVVWSKFPHESSVSLNDFSLYVA